MSDDNLRHEAATGSDDPRQAATSGDSECSLSIEEALARYEAAGLARTTRSIQRYCAKGHLDAHRIDTQFGERFLITPASVDRHIAYIKEVRQVATGRDVPRHAATAVAAENKRDLPTDDPATGSDNHRQAATADRYVARLEGENEFLRAEIGIKNKQIADLQERAHETNALINGLQKLLAPLLSAPARERDRAAEQL